MKLFVLMYSHNSICCLSNLFKIQTPVKVYDIDVLVVQTLITFTYPFSDKYPFDDKMAALLKEMDKVLRHDDLTDDVTERPVVPVKAGQSNTTTPEQSKPTV